MTDIPTETLEDILARVFPVDLISDLWTTMANHPDRDLLQQDARFHHAVSCVERDQKASTYLDLLQSTAEKELKEPSSDTQRTSVNDSDTPETIDLFQDPLYLAELKLLSRQVYRQLTQGQGQATAVSIEEPPSEDGDNSNSDDYDSDSTEEDDEQTLAQIVDGRIRTHLWRAIGLHQKCLEFAQSRDIPQSETSPIQAALLTCQQASRIFEDKSLFDTRASSAVGPTQASSSSTAR